MMAREFRLFLVALQFLTRIPVPNFDGFEPQWLDRAAKYFPMIGALVGLIASIVMVASAVVLPEPLPMLLALTAAIAVTGAFHEDGLADTADGLGGGTTRERRLEIMKDSRIGTYGVVALLIVFSLKLTSLSIVDPLTAVPILIAAHAGGRLVTVLAIFTMSYGGDEQAAKVKPLATGLSGTELSVAIVSWLAIGLACLSPGMLAVSTLFAAATAGLVALQGQRLIGGYTGDILGAMEQCFEAIFIVAAVGVYAGPG